MTSTVDREEDLEVDPSLSSGGRLRVVLVVIIAVAGLVAALGVGYLVRGDGGTSTPSASSVDAGFARDMATHHTQAVTMAGYTRDNTADPQVKLFAVDIETSQNFQVGEMQGWLDSWQLSRNSPHPMSWMGHDAMGSMSMTEATMPGMASPAELATLETSHGRALDILFLQLMIRHHQGGIEMGTYAADHASVGYVRDFATMVVTTQGAEIVAMEQLLRKLGGSPLPPPN